MRADAITVPVTVWEACRTPEERAAHAAACIKMGVRTAGRPRYFWMCETTCEAKDVAVETATSGRLRRIRTRLRSREARG